MEKSVAVNWYLWMQRILFFPNSKNLFLKGELFAPFSSCLFKSLKSLEQISLFVQQKIDFANKNGVGLKENIQKYANK